MTMVNPIANDGYVDNLSLVLTGPPPPPPGGGSVGTGEGTYVGSDGPSGGDGGYGCGGFSRLGPPKKLGGIQTLLGPFWKDSRGTRPLTKGIFPYNADVTVLNVSHRKNGDVDNQTPQTATGMGFLGWPVVATAVVGLVLLVRKIRLGP
jgi:hypothetical protein